MGQTAERLGGACSPDASSAPADLASGPASRGPVHSPALCLQTGFLMARWACTVRQGAEATSLETVHDAAHWPPASYRLLRAALHARLANHTLAVLYVGKTEQ